MKIKIKDEMGVTLGTAEITWVYDPGETELNVFNMLFYEYNLPIITRDPRLTWTVEVLR